MQFLNITYHQQEQEISFAGLKVFQTPKPIWFYKLFHNQIMAQKFANCKISKGTTLMVSDCSKVVDLVTFGKNSVIFQQVYELLETQKVFDLAKLQAIQTQINTQLGFELLVEKNEVQKVVGNLFGFDDEISVTKENFLALLKNNVFNERMTFLFLDVDWLKINDVLPFLNEHNFIFITHDMRKNISNVSQLEACVLCNNQLLELFDYQKIISYLEFKLHTKLDKKALENYLTNQDSIQNVQIYAQLQFLQ